MPLAIPTHIVCLTHTATSQTFAIIRPNSYPDLVSRAISLFRLAESLAANNEEIYFEFRDFGLSNAVQLLPEIWDALEELQQLYLCVRMAGTGPLNLPVPTSVHPRASGNLLPSPASSLSPNHRQSVVYSTPIRARTSVTQCLEPAPISMGYRGEIEEHKPWGDKEPEIDDEYDEGHENEEREEGQPDTQEFLPPSRSRMSLQARDSTHTSRPILTRENVAKSQSQEFELASGPQKHDPSRRMEIAVQHEEVTLKFKVKPHHLVSKVFSSACKNFNVDPTEHKLLQLTRFEGSDESEAALQAFECNLHDTMEVVCAGEDETRFVLKAKDPSE